MLMHGSCTAAAGAGAGWRVPTREVRAHRQRRPHPGRSLAAQHYRSARRRCRRATSRAPRAGRAGWHPAVASSRDAPHVRRARAHACRMRGGWRGGGSRGGCVSTCYGKTGGCAALRTRTAQSMPAATPELVPLPAHESTCTEMIVASFATPSVIAARGSGSRVANARGRGTRGVGRAVARAAVVIDGGGQRWGGCGCGSAGAHRWCRQRWRRRECRASCSSSSLR